MESLTPSKHGEWLVVQRQDSSPIFSLIIGLIKAILRDQMAEKLDELDALGALPENNSLLMSAWVKIW